MRQRQSILEICATYEHYQRIATERRHTKERIYRERRAKQDRNSPEVVRVNKLHGIDPRTARAEAKARAPLRKRCHKSQKPVTLPKFSLGEA